MAWFKEWFNTPYYHQLYRHRDYAEAEGFIRALVNALELPPQAQVIDLACGKGRHSVFLNGMGYRVLGLDLSEESIAHNRQWTSESLKFRVHDMRCPITEVAEVDAVFNLFTSFGFFDDPKDDFLVFDSVAGVLSAGGVFVLDFLNERHVRNTLVAESEVCVDGIVFRIHRKLEGNEVVKDIRFEDQGRSHHYFEKVKLHTLEEIHALAEKVGLVNEKIYGDYALNPFELEKSPRCINVFRKEK
ncbi:class I SAM-dependent DNA methyltransferase [Bergeyella sp. RCAD1439]|uniref:class I SAM-dependent DNA methyltransferase n=1 Tax=Bergeyella anatis TaxID=3113737 RepID=UPI002E17EF1B|nr:methyltransferase domain-containing protein [Bergeyella sp. RCAD1439]